MTNMKPSLLRFALLTLLILTFVASPALAQEPPEIADVQPRTVSSSSTASLTITGAGFQEGAAVSLSNYGELETSFNSSNSLTALLPAGVAPGTYTLTVTNPDDSSASLPNALTVEQSQASPSSDPPPSEATATLNPPLTDATATPFVRPLVVVKSYTTSVETVTPGQDFDLVVRVENVGGREAVNIIATFTPGDFVPRQSGGVLARVELQPGEAKKLNQPMTATWDLWGKTVGTAVMQLNYTDLSGAAYTETFNISVPVRGGSGVASTATPTPTGTASPRPQLVINAYNSDTDMLKPGTNFVLQLQAQNVGNGTAKRVSMILGGGSSSSGGQGGTPEPGGVTGGGGDLGNFAPVASSNVQYLGDVNAGASISAEARLIVNSRTEPGAYPMKISFTYTAENGTTYTDDQVITLLVFSPPLVEVNFYRDPGPLFSGQPNQLPLQVVNLGRKPAVLGNMEVTGEGADFTQNSILIGALDTGGYYTLDAMAIPHQPGPLELLVTINYTDDFNEAQVITRTLTVEVQEMVMPDPLTPEPGMGEPGIGEPGMGGGPGMAPAGPETFMQKVFRFVRGLIGLDSAQPVQQGPGEMPPFEEFPGGEPQPVPLPGPKG